MMMRTVLVLVLALCAGTLLLAAVDGSRPQPEAAAREAAVAESMTDGRAASLAGGSWSVPVDTAWTEAHVFRTRPRDLAIDPGAGRRAGAHPRTLSGYRSLRAYPGAPPRVPHGLTADELRRSMCNTCHERGGYSPRFGAYVPLTPHAELQNCLQCHATDAGVVELPSAGERADARCRQCHRPGERTDAAFAIDWRPAAWPRVAGPDATGAPPPIPHELQLRGNCIACHAGPGAVAEIRTAHPERASCRQCHVEAAHGDLASAWGGLP